MNTGTMGIKRIILSEYCKVFLRGVVLLFVMFYAQMEAHAQFSVSEHAEKCSHHCAEGRIALRQGIGIYEQDERLHHYDVVFYGIDLEVVPSSTFLNASARVLARITTPTLRYFVLELTNELTVSAVRMQGVDLNRIHAGQVLEIDLGDTFVAGQMIDVEIFYTGTPQPQGVFSGIQTANNNFGDPVLWTLSEPHNARQWFPVKQVLEDKADSVHVSITTPVGFVGASNGLLVNTEFLPGNKVRYDWKTFYPIAFYLISIAVSNYQEFSFNAPLKTEGDSVWVQNFLYNHAGVLETHRQALLRSRGFMQLFSEIWGNYPFATEKYGHVQAPMFGAMEHQTLSTMGGFGFDITAHELAHHWFGNHVTCGTWSDIWINEGFASYGEYLAREFLQSRQEADQWMASAHSDVKSQPGGSVYIPPHQLGDVRRIFNGRLSYRKGAAILHQLRFELNNDALFFMIMEVFQQKYAHAVATGDNFRQVLEWNTGQSWEWFFDQWYYGEGYPMYEIVWWQQHDKLFIRSSQRSSASFPEFFAGTLEFEVQGAGEPMRIRVFQDQPLQIFEIYLNQPATQLILDPDKYMLQYHTLTDTTGLLDAESPSFEMFPNPFSDRFTLRVLPRFIGGRYEIFNMQGALVKQGSLTNHEQSVDLSFVPAGIYLMHQVSPGGQRTSLKISRYP